MAPGCWNCEIYGWEQERIDSNVQESLLRCLKCKIVHYCGRDCQVEHWVKVHKEKCKYYRGDKEPVAGVHRHVAGQCNDCKEEQDIKEGQWGCHMKKNENFCNPIISIKGLKGEVHQAPLAVELGELTGNFSSRLEHVVSVLQKILHKMDMTGHTLSRKEQFINLTQEVTKLRMNLLVKVSVKPSEMIDNFHGFTFLLNHDDILLIIHELSNQYEDNVNDVYRLWDTFSLIFRCFLGTENYLLKTFEDGGFKVKEKTVKIWLGQVEKSAKKEEMWDKLGSVLSPGPVPYLTILEIVIGSLTKKCSACKDDIIIKSTHGYYPTGSYYAKGHNCITMQCAGSGREKIPNVIGMGNLLRFHCGKLDCRSEVVDSFHKDKSYMMGFMLKAINEYYNNLCNWCYKVKKTVHRCKRCLTKVYCSEECANMDWWKVHKEVCKENPDGWKKKGMTLLSE